MKGVKCIHEKLTSATRTEEGKVDANNNACDAAWNRRSAWCKGAAHAGDRGPEAKRAYRDRRGMKRRESPHAQPPQSDHTGEAPALRGDVPRCAAGQAGHCGDNARAPVDKTNNGGRAEARDTRNKDSTRQVCKKRVASSGGARRREMAQMGIMQCRHESGKLKDAGTMAESATRNAVKTEAHLMSTPTRQNA